MTQCCAKEFGLGEPVDADGFFAEAEGRGFTEVIARNEAVRALDAIDGDGIFCDLTGGLSGGGSETREYE